MKRMLILATLTASGWPWPLGAAEAKSVKLNLRSGLDFG